MEQRDFIPILKSLFLTIHDLGVQSATLRGLLQSKGLCAYQDYEVLHKKIHESAKNRQIRQAVSNLSVDSDMEQILQVIAKSVS